VKPDILYMGKFKKHDHVISVAFPVVAIECEATPPQENYLDAYQETVLKLVSIGLPPRVIASSLNATESLVEELLESLEIKEYAKKETGKPWRITEDGEKYLHGNISERETKNTQYGYMFINAIKREVLPFFYQGDINQVPLFRGESLPVKITMNGSEESTFSEVAIRRSSLRDAFKRYYKNADIARQHSEGEITIEEAIDLFEGLESFDEEEIETLEDVEKHEQTVLDRNMFIRALHRPQKFAYLTMQLIIDPQCPGGYKVESPFDFNGIDNIYFLRQIQWLAASGNTFIGDEDINSFLTREIRKLSPSYSAAEKDFSVFVLEKSPLLKIQRDRFVTAYDDLGRIYSLMQRQSSLIDKENIVNNLSRYILENIMNEFFKGYRSQTLSDVMDKAVADLDYLRLHPYVEQILRKTALDPQMVSWSPKYLKDAIRRLKSTRGNSIVEKFINVIILNYYCGTAETNALMKNPRVQSLYNLADRLNQIRRKVSHDTESRFSSKDYDFYISNVFTLINGLLEAFREAQNG